jgi:hypothetical protein
VDRPLIPVHCDCKIRGGLRFETELPPWPRLAGGWFAKELCGRTLFQSSFQASSARWTSSRFENQCWERHSRRTPVLKASMADTSVYDVVQGGPETPLAFPFLDPPRDRR